MPSNCDVRTSHNIIFSIQSTISQFNLKSVARLKLFHTSGLQKLDFIVVNILWLSSNVAVRIEPKLYFF